MASLRWQQTNSAGALSLLLGATGPEKSRPTLLVACCSADAWTDALVAEAPDMLRLSPAQLCHIARAEIALVESVSQIREIEWQAQWWRRQKQQQSTGSVVIYNLAGLHANDPGDSATELQHSCACIIDAFANQSIVVCDPADLEGPVAFINGRTVTLAETVRKWFHIEKRLASESHNTL